MNPGETFYITLQNNLQASNDKTCTTTGGNFCEAATTNLHTHGLHVSSKGMENGLSYYSDDIFAMIEPGASAAYRFAIPSNHMGGTHWYHPHNHHATAIQAGGGAAGVLIVDDPVGYLPTEYSSMTEKVLFISGHNLVTLQDIATASQSTLMTSAATDAQNSNLDTNVFLVNGQLGPSMTVSSHAWYRLRMVYAAVEQRLELTIAGDATCQTQLLAKDGVYLSTIPRAVTTIYLFPGARSDIALACTCQTYPCTSRLESNAGGGRRLQPMGRGGAGPGDAGGNVVTVAVMEIIVTDSGAASTPSLPTTSLQRPCYLADLQSATVPNANTGTLDLNGAARSVTWNGQGNSMTYQAIHANSGTMSTWPALTSFAVGSIYQIAVTGAGAHPLHLHINPFQITALDAAAGGGGYFQVGDWHDTLLLTAGGNQLTVRMNTDTFTGKMVIHCHILEHEDEGMMAWLDVTGSEGTTYSGNKQLDSTCYESDQQLSTLTSSTNSGSSPTPSTTTTGAESSSTTSVSANGGSSPTPTSSTPSSPTPSSPTPSTSSVAATSGAQDTSNAETFTMGVVMSSLVVKLLA
jgi:FtsP/CotA-like multicopper oxidase with cupredoxin domain